MIRFHATAAIAAAMISTSAANAAQEAAGATFDLSESESGHLAIDVMVEGTGPFPFVVDTGASHTAIVQSLAESVGYIPDRSPEHDVQSLTALIEAERYALSEIDFGAGPRSVNAVIVPTPPDETLAAYGLLGADIFESDARIEIDFDARTLRLGAEPLEHSDGYIHPIHDILVGSARMYDLHDPAHVLIDSGSTVTIVNSELARSMEPRDLSVRIAVGGLESRIEHEEEATYVAVRRLVIGGLCTGPMVALTADLDIFRAMGWEDEPAAVIGLDVLEEGAMRIDREAGRFQLDDAPGRSGCRAPRAQTAAPEG